MYQGMKGTGELHKFAATKAKGLPDKKTDEAVLARAEQLVDELLES